MTQAAVEFPVGARVRVQDLTGRVVAADEARRRVLLDDDQEVWLPVVILAERYPPKEAP